MLTNSLCFNWSGSNPYREICKDLFSTSCERFFSYLILVAKQHRGFQTNRWYFLCLRKKPGCPDCARGFSLPCCAPQGQQLLHGLKMSLPSLRCPHPLQVPAAPSPVTASSSQGDLRSERSCKEAMLSPLRAAPSLNHVFLGKCCQNLGAFSGTQVL